MAPPSKKKGESSTSSQTLHKFFASKSVVSQPHVTKRPKAKTQAGTSTCSTASARSLKQPEIILIDSDSDSEPEIIQTITVKRRKLSPKNVDSPSVEDPMTVDKSACQLKENIAVLPGQSISGSNDSKESSETSFSFGVPFLLNQPRSNIIQDDVLLSPIKESSLSTWSPLKGSSVPMVDPPIASSSKNTSEAQSDIAVDIDLTLDLWDDGDDEGFTMEDDQEIEWVSHDVLKAEETSELEAPSLGDETPSDKSNIEDQKCFTNAFNDCSSTQQTRPVGHNAASILITKSSDTTSETLGGNGSNAFSFLMSSLKENEIWKEATVSKERNHWTQKSKGNRQKAPFYKVLQGMPIAVDAFKYGAIPENYANESRNSHAHSDHYTNLSSTWKHGPIYCSHGTANLIIHKLSVDKKWVHPLPMDTPTIIPDTNGVAVTLIEANHCPGSCLFFFEGRQTVNAGDSTFKSSYVGSSRIFRYLHCGDFRASPRHVLHPAVKDKVIDHVYLDTTYLDPKYTFPPQPLVISACAELARKLAAGESTKHSKSNVLSWMSTSEKSAKAKAKEVPKPLIAIGTYSIGKERIAKAVANALNTKIYCDARKTAILKCQDDPELHSMLTTDPVEGFVHLVPLGSISTDQLKLYLERFKDSYDRIIGFRPTGWTYTQAAGTNQSPSIPAILAASAGQTFTYANLQASAKSSLNLTLYPVPYSEHSSFYELTCFAMSFSWVKMIATVNVGSEASRGKMAKWVAKWEAERKKRGKDTIVPYKNPDYW